MLSDKGEKIIRNILNNDIIQEAQNNLECFNKFVLWKELFGTGTIREKRIKHKRLEVG